MVDKKTFKYLISGKLIQGFAINKDGGLMIDTAKKCNSIAKEIIDFAEKYNLFNPDLK